MRIYSSAYELMSEMGRNLYEMGQHVSPKTYQNKVVEGDPDFETKELICEQYCLTRMPDPDLLFIYENTRAWADAEFEERVDRDRPNPGKAYLLRKEVWDQFLVDGKFDYSYSERINFLTSVNASLGNNLNHVIKELSRNQDTRQAVLPIYGLLDVQHIGGNKRVPCSMYYDFLIRENANGEKQLNICYHQRSSDFVTHFGNDVYLAWGMMEFVANCLEINCGYLYHTIDSIHCYAKDWPKLKSSVGEKIMKG
ncbi:MAG: thymidylate synthase [Clostridium sp.]